MPRVFSLSPLAASIALVFAAPMTMAADTPNEPKLKAMPTIQIFAAPELLETTPGSAEVIDRKKLDQLQPLSTQDALRKSPGIHAVDTEGYGFYPRITIRGLGSDMSKGVLLVEDGSPIALGPYTDPATYYSPPIERMDSIEVLKGSGALRYGPSTIGGAINYITRNPEGFRVKATGGSLGYNSLLAEYGGNWDSTTASISALRKEGDGWRDMPFEVNDIVAKAGTAIGESQFIGIKLTQYKHVAQHTYLGLTQKEYEEDYKQNKAKNDEMQVERTGVDLNHELDLGDGASIKTLLYWNNAERDWWREGHSQPTTGANAGYSVLSGQSDGRLREFTVMGIDSRWSQPHQLFGLTNEFELGLRLHDEEMENQRVRGRAGQPANHRVDVTINSADYKNGVREDDTRTAQAIALFAQNRFHLSDSFTITPGVRVEKYEQKRDIRVWQSLAPSVAEVDNTEVVPGIGATWKLSDAATLFAGVHEGFAPPRVADAVSNNGDAVDLDAERSTNFELGARGSWAQGRYEVTFFRLDFDNQLVQASQSGGAGTQLGNAGETLNQGIELGGDWIIGGGFSLAGNYTFLDDAKLTSTRIIGGIDRNGNRLTYAPEHLLNLRLVYEAANWGGNLGASYVSEQYADLENTQAGSANGRTGLLPSYTVWDANAYINADDTVKYTLAVRNLGDEKYIASRAPEGIFPGIGRTLEIGVDIKF